jgi:hypothetical protein
MKLSLRSRMYISKLYRPLPVSSPPPPRLLMLGDPLLPLWGTSDRSKNMSSSAEMWSVVGSPSVSNGKMSSNCGMN